MRAVQLRRLGSGEVGLHREIRLRALCDAPDSFADLFADAAERPATYWEDLTRSVTDPGPHVMFLACAGDTAVGSVYGLLDRERSAAGRVGGMWVAPEWRRRGVGRALLQAVIGWARERGLSPVSLWAPVHSQAALTLYGRAGFQATGNRRLLSANSSRYIVEMEARP